MKIYLLFFSIFQIGFAASYVLEYVREVDSGFVEAVGFDSDGNTYVAAGYEPNHALYVLGPDRSLISKTYLTYGITLVYQMHVLKNKDVYFYFYTGGDFPQSTLAVKRSNSTKVQNLYEIEDDLFFLDPDENLYYTGKSGVHILRPGSDDTIQIKNLENFSVLRPDTAAVDKEGNVYFGVNSEVALNNSLALLTKEELQKEIPEAKLFDILESTGEDIKDIVVDEKNGIWVMTSLQHSYGYFKKFTNGTYETVKMDVTHPDLDVTVAKDRLWVGAANTFQPVAPTIYYITLDNKVVEIPELQNLTAQLYFITHSLVDGDGRAYFRSYNNYSYELGSMIVINPGDMKPIPVQLNPSDPYYTVNDHIAFDADENVWIFASQVEYRYIYVLKKGETTANVIPNFSTDVCHDLYVNPVSKESFIACNGGLTVVVNS